MPTVAARLVHVVLVPRTIRIRDRSARWLCSPIGRTTRRRASFRVIIPFQQGAPISHSRACGLEREAVNARGFHRASRSTPPSLGGVP